MRPRERHKRILAALGEAASGRVNVNELAEQLGVSRETIRRDLTRLANEGLLRKVHGGAARFQTAQESAFEQRLLLHRAEKIAIGAEAARLLQPGDSLFVDAGSTTILFAQQLAAVTGLTVITNCVSVAEELANGSGANRVLLLGGAFDGEVRETTGPMVIQQIQRFHADHAFICIGAISADGVLSDFSLEEAHVAAAMVERAGSTTVLADSSKLGKLSLVEVCRAEDIDRLITDRALPPDMARRFERAGVEVRVASVGEALSA
jgi:DeoR/GlpR family transcriptional regulator of sugar metabolism